MKIAACLIVKNSADVIERAIDSIRPFVDGIFVYDTGSTDGTPKLLRALNKDKCLAADRETGEVLGKLPSRPEDDDAMYVPLAEIRVQRGEWRDDFAWARQQSWAMIPADYDWAIWLDDDDEIVGAPNLRPLAATAHPTVDGFVVFYDYARDENGQCVCQLWRERLIRVSSGLEWKGAVHEVLIPPSGRPPNFVMVPPEQLRYVHHRPDGRYENTRNLNILLADRDRSEAAGELPDARTLAYIGTELMAQGRIEEACAPLHAYLEHPGAQNPSDERMQVMHKLAACLRLLDQPHAALEVEFRALRERDDWTETAIGLMEGFAQLGDWPRVETWARRALDQGMPRSMLILNPLEFTFMPYMRLSEATALQDRYVEAESWLGRAAQAAPGHPMVEQRAMELAHQRTVGETVNHVLALRETLIRHDENLKAHELLTNVPYFVADDPRIVNARAGARENVKHALQPEEYRRWYAEEPKESTIPDDQVEVVGEFIARAKQTLELARSFEAEHGRKPRILDLGGNDMWMACYLWVHGEFHVDGVELNKSAYEKGLARMERFGAPGRLVQGDLHDARELLDTPAFNTTVNGYAVSGNLGFGDYYVEPYDIVMMYEVLEHVPDVHHTLAVMESLCSHEGLVCVTTPDGAFEAGNLNHWHVVERKGHLRAMPAHELAELLLHRGELETFIGQDGNRLTFAAYKPRPSKGKVVMYAGGGWEPWSPASIQHGGLGGSETALVQVACRMARRGYEVKVYSGAEPGVYGGALFRPFTAWDPTEEADLLIVSRRPDVFDNPIGAKRTALWCHDHSYPGAMTEERAEKIDEIIVLSEWQRARFADLYPYAEDKLRIVRNGISLVELNETGDSRFPDAGRSFKKRKPRAIYSSSADRGLDVLLQVWPQIRERVPNAELHVFYGWDVFDQVARLNPVLREYKQKVIDLYEAAGGEEGGVFMRGRIGQRDLAEEMQLARVLAYPTAFLETSCITAMEARAAGMAIVTSDLAALHETVGTNGMLLAWDGPEDGEPGWEPHNTTPEYQQAFVEAVSRLLADQEQWGFWHRAALKDVDGLDWERRVDEWEALVAARERHLVAV